MPGDTVIKTIIDPDLGRLDLIEARRTAAGEDGAWEPAIYRGWAGEKGHDRSFFLSLTATDDPPQIEDAMRICFRQSVRDIDALRRQLAAVILPVAQRWAEASCGKIALDEEKLGDLLALDAIELSATWLTLYFALPVDIFAGRLLEVRLSPAGEIARIALAG